VLSIESDILFPPSEQQFLAKKITGAGYQMINSDYGHDGFLLEYDQISKAIEQHLSIHKKSFSGTSGQTEVIIK
jgi:homoserine O-acetyltransferase